MNAELKNVCDILDRKTPPTAKPRCFAEGFSFDPSGGHKLGLPASYADALEQATQARLTIRGSGTLAFAIDLALQDDASGELGQEHALMYVNHRDTARHAALSDLVVTHLLPPAALSIEIAAVGSDGEALARKRAILPRAMFVDINRRVSRAQNTSYRQHVLDQSVAMLAMKRETQHERQAAIVQLIAPE
jgi:hypothetical protein